MACSVSCHSKTGILCSNVTHGTDIYLDVFLVVLTDPHPRSVAKCRQRRFTNPENKMSWVELASVAIQPSRSLPDLSNVSQWWPNEPRLIQCTSYKWTETYLFVQTVDELDNRHITVKVTTGIPLSSQSSDLLRCTLFLLAEGSFSFPRKTSESVVKLTTVLCQYLG